MGSIKLKVQSKTQKVGGKRVVFNYYTGTELKKFNHKLLGIGDLNEKSKQMDVIAAVFDLEGFTGFCRQPDPYLVLPEFLSSFLNWLFEKVVTELTRKKFRAGRLLHTELPFFAKFLGDGVLFLWSTENMDRIWINNVIVLLSRICNRYSNDFAGKIGKEMSYVPKHLRCGVARGSVCSVGGGKDYVGPCINIASRLQKLSGLKFCFALKGIDFFMDGMPKENAKRYVVKSTEIRGLGKDERVCLRKSDYEQLTKREKGLFRDV